MGHLNPFEGFQYIWLAEFQIWQGLDGGRMGHFSISRYY